LVAGCGLSLSPIFASDTVNGKATTQTVSNQKLADEIAGRIKASGSAEGANVQIQVQSGKVVLTGTCLSQDQQKEIAKFAMSVKGVSEVALSMQVVTKLDESAQLNGRGLVPVNMQTQEPAQLALQAPPPPAPMASYGAPGIQDPIPLVAPGQAGYDPYGPKLPNYAWPTYAPYNNVSRVAYPQAYPYNAFPFIGPYYPFPKVPLGWRTVQLSWEDGHWYMGRVSTPHDYWRVRFW
jgi:hypothetical protein